MPDCGVRMPYLRTMTALPRQMASHIPFITIYEAAQSSWEILMIHCFLGNPRMFNPIPALPEILSGGV